jgi:hypothetical protein
VRNTLSWLVAVATWISAASLIVISATIVLMRYASLTGRWRHAVLETGIIGVYVSFFAVTLLIVGFALSRTCDGYRVRPVALGA